MATPLDTLNQPGDYVMDYAFLVNHKGESVDITATITELNIYENIDRPFITGEVAFTDSNGIVKDNELNLGQEFLVVKLRTPEMPVDIENIVDSSKIAFRIVSVKSDEIKNTFRYVKYAFTTKEFVRDKQIRISKTYEDTYSEMVKDVLNNENYLSTDKDIIVEPSRGTKKFTLPDVHPVEFINMVRRKAQSADRENVGFLFYERLDNQFHFRSFGSLVANGKSDEESIRTYTLQKAGARPGQSPKERLLHIVNLEPQQHHNQITNLNEGYYGSKLGSFDLYTKTYTETKYNHFDAYNTIPHLNYTEEGDENDKLPHAKTPDRLGNRLSDYADYVQINTVHTTADDNTLTNPENTILQQRSQDLNWRQNRIQLEVYGCAGIHAGDVIRVNVPSINIVDHLEPEIEPSYSGVYIIEAIQHRFIMQPIKTHKMLFTCIRDSQEISISAGDNNNEAPSTHNKVDIDLTPSHKV